MEHNRKSNSQLINFLHEQMNISASFVNVLLYYCDYNPGFLLISLWRYDLLSLEQLEQIMDWLDS